CASRRSSGTSADPAPGVLEDDAGRPNSSLMYSRLGPGSDTPAELLAQRADHPLLQAVRVLGPDELLVAGAGEPVALVEGPGSVVAERDPQLDLGRASLPGQLADGGDQAVGQALTARGGADPHGHEVPAGQAGHW